MSRAVLSVGSNLGDRAGWLRQAVAAVRPVAVSCVYETPPWGPVVQGDYLNAVLIVETTRSPHDLLAWAHTIEAGAERVRDVRWGPRTLDVDVVTYDDVIEAGPELTLPHPRAHERAFVLLPWLDLEPEATLPGRGRVAELAADLAAGERHGPRRRDDVELW